MTDFFHDKGILSVSIGEGWLSSFETGVLAPGDIVRTGRNAGRPSTLRFNGCEMAPCEVVILGDVFGVRVTGVEPLGETVSVPGTRDDLVELLPASVVLGSIRVSPGELRGVGRNTIISLGKPWSESEDAELWVAGVPIALGKVVAIEEEMGIRITKVMAKPFTESNIRASGFLVDSHSWRRVKTYDFRRPDKFSKVAILNMADIHCLFLRNLRTRLPEAVAGFQSQHEPTAVDQCTFSEALQALEKEGRFELFAAENLVRRRPEGLPAAEGRFAVRGTALLEEEGTRHPVAPESRRFIDELATTRDYVNRQPVLIYHREGTAVRTALATPEGREAFLSCLRGGWKNLVDLNLRPMPDDDPFARQPWIPAHDMVITVAFNAADGKAAMVIVYPYLTLEPLAGVMG